MKFRYLSLSFVLMINLSGCVGYAALIKSTNEPEYFSPEKFINSEEIHAAKKNNPTNGTKIYNKKSRWCGLIIFAVIPIPLVLPVCNSFTEVDFENSEIIKETFHHVEISGFMCSPLFLLSSPRYGLGGSRWL